MSHINSISNKHKEIFRNCITKVDTWDTSSGYFIYNKLYKKDSALGVWLFLRSHVGRGVTNVRNFITNDSLKDKKVVILYWYESRLK